MQQEDDATEREKRKRADVFVFELLDSKKESDISVEMDITRDLLKKYEDISDSALYKRVL